MLSFADIAKIFEEIELRLIASLKRNLKRHKSEEQKTGFEYSAWQAEKLKNVEEFRKQNQAIMNEYIDVIDEQTRQLMNDEFHEGERLVSEKLGDESYVPDTHFFGVNEKKMQSLITDITSLENKAETAALRMTDDIYRQTVNKVQLAMGMGEMTLNKAIDIATKDFLDKGINCIVYSDGKRVNIADYVRMALRTTSTRASLQGQAKRFAELGYDTVIVSQYGGCSETCEPWQGQVYIDDVFTVWQGECDEYQGKSNYCGEWFWLLSYAVKNGLFHPNCRHTMSQYIHGVTEIPQPIPADKIKKQRELEQKQRYLERKIRKFKRFQAGSCDPETAKAYGRKVREAQAELRELIKDNEPLIKRDYEREKVYEGEVDKAEKSDIIKAEEVKTLEQAKKRDHKIYITDVAINSVDKVKPSDFTDEQASNMQIKHKELLMLSKDKNESNEVLFIDDLNFKSEVQILGEEFVVSPAKNPFAVSVVKNAERQSLIYLHNHPSTNNFSVADIDTFICEGSIKAMSVVTNQGEVYVLNRRANYEYNKARQLMSETFYSFEEDEIDNNEFVRRFIKKCNEGGIEYVKSK